MHVRRTILAAVVLCVGCGDPQDSQTNTDLGPREDAICDFAGPKALCRASAEGVRAHIEEFGPLQKEMDWVILDGFDPNDVEELKAVESVVQLQLTNLNSKNLGFLEILASANRIRIERNFQLESLQGLNNLESVDYSFQLFENTKLISLEGLENLRRVGSESDGEGLTILQHESLVNLEGLSSLETVFLLNVQNNSAMASPGTLPKLRATEAIVFDNNDAMVDAGSYPALEKTSVLKFVENNSFPDCEGEKVAEAIPNFDGKLTLEDNKPNSRCAALE